MSLPVRIRIALVVFVTLLATALGVWNLSDRVRWNDPTDGFVWRLGPQGLRAALAMDGFEGPSLIRVGDVLVGINGHPVRSEGDYYEAIYALGVGGSARYELLRAGDSAHVTVPVVIGKKAIFSATDFYRAFIGFTYLIIGVVLGMRHWRSPGAQHFYVVCTLSYILYLFTYTNRLSLLDMSVYWSSAFALLLLPPVFVHFCLNFPERQSWTAGRPSLAPFLYVPFVVLSLVQIFWSLGRLAGLGLPLNLRSSEWIDKFHITYFGLYFLAGALILARGFLEEQNRYRRQQWKWITIGTLAGILPFFAFYVIPFVLGVVPNVYLEASSLSLTLIPLSFAYAVVRYKLMDVDIIFKRSLTYALAGSLTLAGYFLLVVTSGRLLSQLLPEGGSVAIGAAALTIAFLFAPLRNKIQDYVDRVFYREKYDYRDSLIEFGQALTTEISLERLASQILGRIKRTFDVEGVALLMEVAGHRYHYRVVQSEGLAKLPTGSSLQLIPPLATLALNANEDSPAEPLGGLDSLEVAGVRLVQPFSRRGKVVGLLVLGSPRRGGLFTSEDYRLLQVLGGYAAIALENAGLYHTLEAEANKLEQLRIFNENIIESINVGVVSVDLEGVITACNGAFEKLYGVERGQVVGSHVQQVFSPDVIRALQICTGTQDWVITRGASLYKHYVDTRVGGAAIVNLSLIPLQDRRNTLTGSLLVLDDITEKVRMENQLLQSEKLSSIGLLAAGIAHEVNTPIAGISSYTQMLLKQIPAEDPRHELLAKVEKQTFRASEIVSNLLNFARLNEGKFDHLDVNSLIRESLSLLEHQFRGNQIEVRAELQESLPKTYGNSSKLQQVLVNLMLNAKDAMPSGGTLKIKTTRNNGNILIDITDTGEGMTPEVLSHIYDPFYTTKDVGQGTGLGLAVSYGIIQEHSGRIFVESTPGVGTHFQLKLPAARVN